MTKKKPPNELGVRGTKPLYGEPMKKVTIMLPIDTVEAFKAEGQFYQHRIREAIMAAATKLTPAKAKK